MRESDTAQLFAVRVDDEEWREARSLSEAGPQDNVFVVDRSTASLGLTRVGSNACLCTSRRPVVFTRPSAQSAVHGRRWLRSRGRDVAWSAR